MSQQTIGFIGLGNQGAPIAHRIAKAGFPLLVWARRPEALAVFTAAGASAAPSTRHAGRRAPHTLRCDESSHTIALRGIRWRPSYLVEIPDFAPSPRDEFAFFSVGLSVRAHSVRIDQAPRTRLDKCSSRATRGDSRQGSGPGPLTPRDSAGPRARRRARRRC